MLKQVCTPLLSSCWVQGEEQRRNREQNKRVRVDAPVLERELFRLFEIQPSWTFQQLQLETKQPTMHLKAVLEQVSLFGHLSVQALQVFRHCSKGSLLAHPEYYIFRPNFFAGGLCLGPLCYKGQCLLLNCAQRHMGLSTPSKDLKDCTVKELSCALCCKVSPHAFKSGTCYLSVLSKSELCCLLSASFSQIAVLQKRGLGKDAYVLKEEYAIGQQEGGEELQE